VRAGALYHDVGKLARPEFFSENQSDDNPHDGLSARESAAIIKAHVAEGVSRVNGSRLGEAIAAFVREHHGRSTVSYFLDLARQRGEPADEEAFRYPGPSPASRETAILMIADRVEATSRSMPGASEPELREMVGRTIDRLRLDGELDRAPLTLGDLQGIAGALVQALGGARHQRVAYPPAPSRSH